MQNVSCFKVLLNVSDTHLSLRPDMAKPLPDHKTAQDLLSAWCWREEAA